MTDKQTPAVEFIEDVPFDISTWGDMDVPPVDEKLLSQLKAQGEPRWFRKLRVDAEEARKDDLAR